MKKQHYANTNGGQPAITLVLAAILTLGAIGSAWSRPSPPLRFAVMGDHRGDNKAWDTNTWDRYTDGGITKPVLIDIADALKHENVRFVLSVGDLVTKWTKQLTNTTKNALFASELADWAAIWQQHAGNLPIYPVRGNQEVSASIAVWQNFVRGMPGIGSLTPNGPAGEEWMTYSFTYANCLFVAVDQYMPPGDNDTHYITPAAMEWLDQQLDPRYQKLTRSGHKFVFGHAPAFEIWDMKEAPFTVSKDGLASPYTKYSFDFKGINFMAMRDLFWEIIGQRKAEYFCGHDHIYARALALDTKGRVAQQTIIGNGGAPPPALPRPDYTQGPFAETYTGIPFATLPTNVVYQLESPRVVTESFPLFDVGGQPAYGFGYVIIEVAGPRVTAVYKAEPSAGAGFVEVDRWIISGGDDD